MRQDVLHGLRLIRQQPLLSAVMIATLALGIGLDGGAFTVVDGMLFRARVRDDPSTFVQLDIRDRAPGAPLSGGLPMATKADYFAYRDRTTTFRTLAAWTPVHATLRGTPGAPPHDLVPTLVSCNFFAVYATRPILGRVLRDDDCEASAATPVAVIGEELWRSELGASPTAVGRTILLNDRPFVVVGVLPSGYDGRIRGPMWIPYTTAARFFGGYDIWADAAAQWLVMIGRLRSGVAPASAAAELTVIARQQDALVPGRTSVVRLTNGSIFSMLESPAIALSVVPLVLGTLSLVLVVACANVTMLLLSRAAARQHEIAVRLSLGATRARLVRMLLTESSLMAGLALPISAAIAYEVPRLWRLWIPTMPFYPFDIDLVSFAYLAGVAMAAGCLAALAPALEASRGSVSAALHGENALSGRKWRTADALVVVQVAVSLVLLVGAVVMLGGERSLHAGDAGFESAHVLVATPRVVSPPYTAATAPSYYGDLALRIRQIPGVRAVALASAPPVGPLESGVQTMTLRRADGDAGVLASPAVNRVTAEYFTALSIGIVRGRLFRDEESGAPVPPVVISETLASAWPAGRAVGARVKDMSGREFEIVGVVRDVRGFADADGGARIVYVPRLPSTRGDALLVRFEGDSARAARSVAGAMRALDPDSVAEPRTLADVRDDVASRFMRLASVAALLGAVAIALAIIGLYGVTAFAAGRRTKELGIRIALGASRADIAALVLRSGMGSIAVGLAAGLAIALPASSALQRIIGHVPLRVRDPGVFAACAACLALVALAAAAGPARRAALADPVHALRQD